MPQKRPPRKVTKQDVEELEKVTAELKKREVRYPEAGGGELIMKDACKISYPEPTGGELFVKKDSTIDTHRVELKKIRSVPKVKIAGPEDTAKFVRELEDSDRERFVVIWLDTKNRVLGVENVSTGSINQAIVHPREALKGAVLANAAGVILVHNHPSGIPQPSLEDDELVAKLREVFKLVGIQVLDAIIIGKEGYYSYLVQNRLDKQITGGVERIMEAREDDACTVAMRAAVETMGKYCTETNVVEIDGRQYTLPYEVMQIRENGDMTYDQRVQAIKESKWAINEARGLCALIGEATPECIEKVSKKLAVGMVLKS